MASKTRDKLLEVARQLFTLKGVAHTTMNDIANASAKGRRTIYTYFKNKKEIYNALLEKESDQLVESLNQVMSLNIPVDEKLSQFLRTKFEHQTSIAPQSTYLNWLKIENNRLSRIRRLAHEKEISMLRKLLNQGIEEDVFSPIRCKLLIDFLSTSFKIDDEFDQFSYIIDKAELLKANESFIEFIITDIKIK